MAATTRCAPRNRPARPGRLTLVRSPRTLLAARPIYHEPGLCEPTTRVGFRRQSRRLCVLQASLIRRRTACGGADADGSMICPVLQRPAAFGPPPRTGGEVNGDGARIAPARDYSICDEPDYPAASMAHTTRSAAKAWTECQQTTFAADSRFVEDMREQGALWRSARRGAANGDARPIVRQRVSPGSA